MKIHEFMKVPILDTPHPKPVNRSTPMDNRKILKHAARLLRHEARCIKEAHVCPRRGWKGEERALAAWAELMLVARQLSKMAQ